jgi:hypothetical protein
MVITEVLCTLRDAPQYFATRTIPPIFLTTEITRELLILKFEML